jgi:hypothetical protein
VASLASICLPIYLILIFSACMMLYVDLIRIPQHSSLQVRWSLRNIVELLHWCERILFPRLFLLAQVKLCFRYNFLVDIEGRSACLEVQHFSFADKTDQKISDFLHPHPPPRLQLHSRHLHLHRLVNTTLKESEN